jgi:hypothetical protein
MSGKDHVHYSIFCSLKSYQSSDTTPSFIFDKLHGRHPQLHQAGNISCIKEGAQTVMNISVKCLII